MLLLLVVAVKEGAVVVGHAALASLLVALLLSIRWGLALIVPIVGALLGLLAGRLLLGTLVLFALALRIAFLVSLLALRVVDLCLALELELLIACMVPFLAGVGRVVRDVVVGGLFGSLLLSLVISLIVVLACVLSLRLVV